MPGSLRARSSNLLLLETAAARAPAALHIELFTRMAEIPLFQPDAAPDALAPAAVIALRAAIASADAVLFSVPEYAHGLPGALKNALDWLVSGTELTGKPVALLNTSARSVYAQSSLREVLLTLGARFLDGACATIPVPAGAGDPRQLAADPALAAPLTAALQRLIEALRDPRATARQPIGPALLRWQPRPYPERRSFHGRYCRIEPLDPTAHGDELYATLCDPAHSALFTYLLTELPATREEWQQRLARYASSRDPLYFTLFNEQDRVAGIASYLRIVPEHGVIEVGHIHLSPSLQQTRAATEFQYLLMRHAFEDLGYRRYEWKCDALNLPSRRAAQRLGFRFEGIFLKAIVYKGRSRDTAWYSITDDEWPTVRQGCERWLAPENFDSHGQQLRPLAAFRQQPDL
jgi:RimJ/RimL family protein N-acetyltransferase/NAD(P)H-dependent FMN reductase